MLMMLMMMFGRIRTDTDISIKKSTAPHSPNMWTWLRINNFRRCYPNWITRGSKGFLQCLSQQKSIQQHLTQESSVPLQEQQILQKLKAHCFHSKSWDWQIGDPIYPIFMLLAFDKGLIKVARWCKMNLICWAICWVDSNNSDTVWFVCPQLI